VDGIWKNALLVVAAGERCVFVLGTWSSRVWMQPILKSYKSHLKVDQLCRYCLYIMSRHALWCTVIVTEIQSPHSQQTVNNWLTLPPHEPRTWEWGWAILHQEVSGHLPTKQCPKTTPLQKQQMAHTLAWKSHRKGSCEQNIWEGIF